MRPLLIVCTLALSLLSCKKERTENNTQAQEKIGNNLRIFMVDTGNGLKFDTRTEERYPCSNYPIIYTVDKIGLQIIVHYRHVLATDMCLTAFGPATADVSLGKLDPAEYTLTLRCNGKEHTMALTVSDDKYTVSDTLGQFFKFHNAEAVRR